MKKSLVAIIVALLTLTGVVIPDKYVDAFVTIFMPRATASELALMPWSAIPYRFQCDWYCTCPPVPKYASTVEDLRPSSSHFRDGRVPNVERSTL